MRSLGCKRTEDHAESGKDKTQEAGDIDVDQEVQVFGNGIAKLAQDQKRERSKGAKPERRIGPDNVCFLPVSGSPISLARSNEEEPVAITCIPAC